MNKSLFWSVIILSMVVAVCAFGQEDMQFVGQQLL